MKTWKGWAVIYKDSLICDNRLYAMKKWADVLLKKFVDRFDSPKNYKVKEVEVTWQ